MTFTAFVRKLFSPTPTPPPEDSSPEDPVNIAKEAIKASLPAKRLVVCEGGLMTIIGAYYPLPDVIHIAMKEGDEVTSYSLFKVMKNYGLYRKTALLDAIKELDIPIVPVTPETVS